MDPQDVPAPSEDDTVEVALDPSAAVITYAPDLPDDAELGACGDVGDRRRAIELGISDEYNAVAFALQGAKSIAIDPDADRVGILRRRATANEVHVECHEGELADLGFATSGSVDVVLANHTLAHVDDLGRLLRQVHRVLVPGGAFVMALRHPFDEVIGADGRPRVAYGTSARTIGEWFLALSRSNFRIDVFHELGVTDEHPWPSTLVLRARKEGS